MAETLTQLRTLPTLCSTPGGDLRHSCPASGADQFLADGFQPRPVCRATSASTRRLAVSSSAWRVASDCQLFRAPHTGPDQNDVLENNPAGMFHPPPGTRRDNAEHRFRPEDSANRVIHCDHDRCRAPARANRDKSQERQRSENMKMRFNSTAGKVNQHGRMHHLRGGDDIPRDRLAGPHNHQRDRTSRDESPEKDRGPDMRVNMAFQTLPSPR